MYKIKCVCIMISMLLLTGACSNESAVTYTSITIDEMYEIIDDGIIIDVRTYEEYEIYNIDGSINIPLDELEGVETIINDKSAQIFVYCASGARSSEAATILINLGYTNVYDIGGIYS